ncbi:MAG TPA: lysylphosphatidylglycerol synthase domain-containing protein [Gemmatimonadales bacterium]|nr:lysylphosphatidylglycerol synthase domain-containing protein [Gemmatimonadales bacterium]
MADRRIRAIQWLLGITIVGFALRSLVRNWDQLRAQPLDWSIDPLWLILSAVVVWLMYGLLIAAWRIMLTGWGRGLDFWSAARIWTVSSLGKYLPGKVWAVAGMAVLAQRAGVGAGPATASAIILQVLAIGTGALVAALTGWSSLRSAYPGAESGLAVLVLVSLVAVGVLLRPDWVRRLVRIAAPEVSVSLTPPAGAVVFGVAANTVAWIGYGSALWLLARGLLPGAGLGLMPAIAVFTASYLAGFLALFAPGGIGVREGVFILMLQGPIGIGAATALAVASRVLLTVTELGAAVPFLLFPGGKPSVAH